MSSLKLIIGNKKYSSWSMRPWIALKHHNIEFEEELSRFDHSTMHAHFWNFSPTKKVPVLVHDGLTVWDSLAILEYIAECYPEAKLWPVQRSARARARSVSNEMHSGFLALRNECPMNMARPPRALELTQDCLIDIKRIETLFENCYREHDGEFLFDHFTIADAMFAPVVNRVRTYELSQHPAVLKFCNTIEAMPAWKQWAKEGYEEPWVCELVEF